MNEMRPAELAGSQLGSPGDEESMEEKRACSRGPLPRAVYHLEPACVSLRSGKKVYIFCLVFQELVLSSNQDTP